MTTTHTDQAGAREAEVAREQSHVDVAYARVEELRAETVAREQASQRAVPGADEREVYERDVALLNAARRRTDLDAAGEGLVFGRLDLQDGTVHHVGRLGVRTDTQQSLVVDWRAPAAAPFYQATAARPLEVVRRRTISSRGARVLGVEDDLLDPDAADHLEGAVVVGDGAFLAAVSRERGTHMRDIVATIQAEQDRAVRAPDDGALLVTGGPGTGKTAVALHRVAYLMYARRDVYTRRGVLVVGPSAVFLDYISHVLPALGETSVRLSSLGGLATVPRGVTVEGHDTPLAAAAKGSARMAELLQRVVAELARPRQVEDLQVHRWGVTVTVSAGELRRRRGGPRGPRSHNAGRAAVAQSVTDAAWRAWQRRPEATRIEADDQREFAAWLRTDPEFLRVVDGLWPVLQTGQVFSALRAGRLPLEGLARGLYDEAEVAALTASWAAAPPGELTPADAAVLDELQELLGASPVEEPDDDEDDDPLAGLVDDGGYGEVTTFAERTRRVRRDVAAEEGYRGFAHVVVDEAQDVSPMQWRALARRGRSATWTIVGDWAQSAWPDVEEVRRALGLALGSGRLREVTLSTNYRTSTEIAALAARVLEVVDPVAVPPAAVRSTGVDPLLVAAADPLAELPAIVVRLLAEVGGTVGVVAPYADADAVRAVVPTDPRVSVVDGWQVKGLEYDACAVVLPEGLVAEAPTRTAGLRSLYVAITRATQRLVVVGRDLPPELTA
jgi:DNA helicase IV